jgi:fatty acid desaturase
MKHIITPIVGLHFHKYFRIDFSKKDGGIYLGFKIFLVICFLTFAYINLTSAVLLILIPYIWIYTAINYWTDCIDHAGILTKKNEIEASRNFIIPKLMRFVFFPRNNCYHLIHHLFPTIPSQHFDQSHKLLMDDPTYHKVNQRKE